jgi:hypothetical protein
MESINLVSGLVVATIVLLVAVTLGVSYLTWAEWRDRRMRDDASKGKR